MGRGAVVDGDTREDRVDADLVAMWDVDGTTIVSHAALDAAVAFCRTRQREFAASIRINHVAGAIVLAHTAGELVAIQVDGHGLAFDVEVIAELNVSSKLDGYTIGDGIDQFFFRLDGDLCPNSLGNRPQQGRHPDGFLFHILLNTGIIIILNGRKDTYYF